MRTKNKKMKSVKVELFYLYCICKKKKEVYL